MNRSEQLDQLAAAMAAAQAKIKNPGLDKVNPHFRSKYSSLASVLDAIRDVAGVNGLTFSQHLSAGEIGIRCESVVIHASGQWMSDTLELPVVKTDAQGFASAATYARRISAQSVWGFTGDDDDDGNSATAAAPDSRKEQSPDSTKIRETLKSAALEGIEAYKDAWMSLDSASRSAVGQQYHSAMKELAAQQGHSHAD